jgi:hypothetical protein
VPPGPPPELLVLPEEIGPGPEIRGRVRSDGGGSPSGLTVPYRTWSPPGRGCFKPRLRAGESRVFEDGSFVFRLDPERYADAPDHIRSAPFEVVAEGHLRWTPVITVPQARDLEEGRNLEDLEVLLRREAVIEGRVIFPHGESHRGIGIHITEKPSGLVRGYRTSTDSAGRFRIDGLSPRRGGYLVAMSDEVLSERIALAGRLRPGETLSVDLTLERRQPVSLTVLVLGYEDGLTLMLDRAEQPLPGPVCRIDTTTGPHLLLVKGPDWRRNRIAVLEIPPGTRNHTVELDRRE